MFEMLDSLYKTSTPEPVIIPVEKPRNCVDKIDDTKEYKRLYYLMNVETYRKRNKEYREKKKLEKEEIEFNKIFD
jgi:hypothetical protein